MTRWAGVAVAAALYFAIATCAVADITLVQDGQPKASIVIGTKAASQAVEAAKALQDTLKRISGATLEIVPEDKPVTGSRILVGRSQAVTALGVEAPSGHSYTMEEEGFVVRTVGADLVLVGNEDWHFEGTSFAVYDFLERDLGCRWFFPGPYGEVLPNTPTITIGAVNRTERPSFRIRDIWYSGWMPVSDDDRRWMTEWYHRNKLSKLELSLPGDGSVTRLAPAEQYFEKHPEIYAIDKDGKRMKDMLCMSEPEAVRIAAETIKQAFRSDPAMLSFGFAPPDGHPQCYCERCQRNFPGFYGKGYGDPSLSEVWFQFANKIAEDVYKEFPQRWVLTNGYANRVRPPESIKSLSPNLGIQSAVLPACSFHPTGSPVCWQRAGYKQVMDRWSNALKFIVVYDYDPGKALDNLPFPMLHNLRKDFPYFKSIGLWGFWTEGENAWMVTHLNYYIRAKLMWNVNADVDALVRDYCQRFYGAAAEPIEQYIWTLEGAVEHATIHETWGRTFPWRPILEPVRERLDTLMRDAESRAANASDQAHLRVFRQTHDHMIAWLAAENAAAEGKFHEAVDDIDRMLKIRDEVAHVQGGLLPQSPKIAVEQNSSAEYQRGVLAALADEAGGTKGELVAMLPRQWEFKKDPEEQGILGRWYLPGSTDGWAPIDGTLYWDMQGYQDERGWSYTGLAWYRAECDVPASVQGKPVRLTFGGIYNHGVWVWVNGVLRPFDAGKKNRTGYYDTQTPVEADVTDLIRPGERNSIAVLVDTEAPGRSPRGGLHRRAFLWTPRTSK